MDSVRILELIRANSNDLSLTQALDIMRAIQNDGNSNEFLIIPRSALCGWLYANYFTNMNKLQYQKTTAISNLRKAMRQTDGKTISMNTARDAIDWFIGHPDPMFW